MAIYPVIMCGGAGTRLWPESRPSRPKQFIPLVGDHSLFQETVLRVAPLARDGGQLVVVGGGGHRDWILKQLTELGVEAKVLLEPVGRDSAPAMAAAAIWAFRRDPDAIVAFVASDHHIPDRKAFQDAVLRAADGARTGRIVTLGVKPTAPSSAYGYIKPTKGGLSPVAAFVEKPDPATAERYIEAGYLWNCGNFIVSARTLIDELKTWAPDIASTVSDALHPDETEVVQRLADNFINAPRISIDYAVMEKTSLASVLEVDFEWSDLGAWDAIAATNPPLADRHVFEDSGGCLVRAPSGVVVGTLGVNNLAIIAEADAILVCDLSRAQEVKALVEKVRARSPQHLDFASPSPEPIAQGGPRFANWLRLNALPVWITIGLAEDGSFAEVLTLDGGRPARQRRTRVQARQIYVYAQAGMLGWAGPWRSKVSLALTRLYDSYLREDGTSRALLSDTGAALDETAMLYDHAFVLFALAAARTAGVEDDTLESRATRLRDTLLADALPNGALKEAGEHPYQANAHMHLLEACLAWEAAGGDDGWNQLADRIALLALDNFIDAKGGFLREFFSADWKPAEGDDGRLVEPGHQFEWAWLLTRYGRSRNDERALAAAAQLYVAGRRGSEGGVAIDAMNDDGSVRSGAARLWPQTEWLKASLILAESAQGREREELLRDASQALRALWRYLTSQGLWHDKLKPDGTFVDEPAPASSFYHIMAAFQQLSLSWSLIEPDGDGLTLDQVCRSV